MIGMSPEKKQPERNQRLNRPEWKSTVEKSGGISGLKETGEESTAEKGRGKISGLKKTGGKSAI